MTKFLKEYRCGNCNKLFFKGDLSHCTIEIKCKNCKQFSTINGKNCQLFLTLKKNSEKRELKDLRDEDIKDAIVQCSDCEEKDDCEHYVHLTNMTCPLCKKSIEKK